MLPALRVRASTCWASWLELGHRLLRQRQGGHNLPEVWPALRATSSNLGFHLARARSVCAAAGEGVLMINPNRMSPLQEWVNDIFQGLGLVFLVAVAGAVLWMLSENRLGFLRSIQWPFK
jgi:hypothetical protein